MTKYGVKADGRNDIQEDSTVGSDGLGSEGETVDVIIIGAGWAGLAAANKLRKRGVKSIRILEARDYIGGRSVTSFELGRDIPVDLGSQWVIGGENNILQCLVQGKRKNPVQSFIRQNNIPHALIEDTYEVRDVNGRPLGEVERNNLETLFQQFTTYVEKRQRNDEDDSNLQKVLYDFIREEGIPEGTNGDLGLRWIVDTEIAQDFAANLSDMSLMWWDNDKEFSGGDDMYLTVPGGGFTAVMSKFSDPIKSCIRLNSRVTTIEYAHDMVKVSYADGARCNKEHSILAQHVLVTLPLGVLKAGTVRFSPPLPQTKLNAINKLGVGNMNKCALYWEGMHECDVFWPKDKEWLAALGPSEKQGKWTEFYNAYSMNGGSPVLIGFVVGKNAWRVEHLSDEDITAEAVASLRQMFGEEKVPQPTKSIVTRWGADQYARGSYSFQKVGSDGESRKDLERNVHKKLWFAGEATDKNYPGTTFGAMLSGEKAAGKILSKIKSRSSVFKRRKGVGT